jgi:hypothetical protein
MKHQDTFTGALRISVPLLVWNTADPAEAEDQIKVLAKDRPIIHWDVAQGGIALNKIADAVVPAAINIGKPVEMLMQALKFPGVVEEQGKVLVGGSVLIMHNLHWFLANPMVKQAVWNLRDPFKNDGRMLIMMGPSMPVPVEWVHDIVTIDEPLPDQAGREAVVKEQFEATEQSMGKLAATAHSVSGLSRFGAEQAVALAMRRNNGKWTLDDDAVGERRRRHIQETKGLSVFTCGDRYDDIGGCDQVKWFTRKFIAGPYGMQGVVWIDEAEKQTGGHGTDSSGTKTDQMSVLLKEMQDHNVQGMLFIGPPGSAKSMFAKATGNEAGVPTIAMDLGAFMDKHVGESQQAIRHGMKVVDAVTEGKPLYIATCNNIDAMPPEFLRRFTLGTFYFDLATEAERLAIWSIYVKVYKLNAKAEAWIVANNATVCEGWTGADIARCAERTVLLGITIEEAAACATPVAQTSPLLIENLRNLAHNSLLSAAAAGKYKKPTAHKEASPKGSRRFAV